MARHYHSQFETSQHMATSDFEIFYYEDKKLSDVSIHRHDYYEVYFFLEGDLSYQIGKNVYPLQYGDICLIPPGVFHRPQFRDADRPYRRIVLWLSPEYFQKLMQIQPDISYCYEYSDQISCHHFSSDFSSAQILFNKLIEIIEEHQRVAAFHAPMLDCYITSLLLSINRVVYQRQQPAANVKQPFLFSNICEYINAHLEEDLSLDALAREFYVSKYHISHVFKDNMGMSVHQYLVKKRLDASKNSILSGMPLHEVATAFGFRDYTSFFRAFKKEFGVAPREFKEAYSLHSSSVPETRGRLPGAPNPPKK